MCPKEERGNECACVGETSPGPAVVKVKLKLNLAIVCLGGNTCD